MRSFSFSGIVGRLVLLGYFAAFIYGFFGPGRDETCEATFDEGDWVANNLTCPGFSALQTVVAFTFIVLAIAFALGGIQWIKEKIEQNKEDEITSL